MQPDRTSMQLVADTEIVIQRTFRAPPEIVFDAWTRPEHLRRWWAPKSRGVTLVQCDAEVRAGGAYRYVLERAGERFAFYGAYREVERPARLVYSQYFEPFPDSEVVITVTFASAAGATTVVAREVYPSKAVRDAALASGMEDGMRESMAQLDQLVGALAAAPASRRK
jgi:uncharacterized protein YndB with AHSA1/START domain